jgi:hypothetical protein
VRLRTLVSRRWAITHQQSIDWKGELFAILHGFCSFIADTVQLFQSYISTQSKMLLIVKYALHRNTSVFQIKVVGPWEEDGSWRKLHNGELHSLYSSTNVVRVIK